MAFRKSTVENMGLKNFWSGRRVFITGHTGFKGSWLCLWLEKLGAQVFTVALPPNTSPSLYKLFTIETNVGHHFLDIRDELKLKDYLIQAEPEIVIHMAAQALVRQSYADPANTYSTNVMGTVNLLEAVRISKSVKTVIVVTTDKVYANNNAGIPFVEIDPLGGEDPYSNSKAATELICQSYRHSFFNQMRIKLATVRAGNVIGGGDWSADRLIPDAIRAFEANHAVMLRYPNAIRPWQHVLEPLHGYLLFAQALIETQSQLPDALNFGPTPENFATVSEVIDALAMSQKIEHAWQHSPGEHPPEASYLVLRSDLAQKTIGWCPRLNLRQTLDWTTRWYAAYRQGHDMRDFSLKQISDYENEIYDN